MAKIISIVNQKGGVGKTTTVINVGASLAEMGFRVLLVDLDPQGNLSSGLGVDTEALEKTVYNSLIGQAPLKRNIEKTEFDNLFVSPSNNDLAGAEIELVDVEGREYMLRESITEDLRDAFDYVLIDCPPSLGLLTINALTCSDSFLVPMQSEFFALQGLTNILRTTKLVKQGLNPELEEEGIIITMFDSRSNFAKQVYQDIRVFAGKRLFSTVIPRRIRLAESTSHGIPGINYDASCFGARSYMKLAKELVLRNQGSFENAKESSIIPPDPIDRFGIKKTKEQNTKAEVRS